VSRVVSRGSIRVDARRAVAKLREHLLVDLNLYLLELVRAAAAGGATAIDVRSDADDVILSFDGPPLEAATLERLLDHVLDAARDREARRVRLLALGVNAALGLSPARIDVLATTGAPGRCVRARFTPATVSAERGDAAARPACEEVAAPPGMPARGMRVEVRRRLGWELLRRAVGGGRPLEIEHLAAATADFPVPITLDGAPLQRPPTYGAPGAAGVIAPLLRVPFHLRGTTRAALEILPVPSRKAGEDERGAQAQVGVPSVEYLEHGVRLLRAAWSFAPRFPSAPFEEVMLPVRVVVDAEELPTNASRSALREDAPLCTMLQDAAHAAFLDAVRALGALVCGAGAGAGAGAVPEGVVVLEQERRPLAEALGAVACVVAGAALGQGEGAPPLPPLPPLPEEARAVLALPILTDGLGRPIAPAALPGRVYAWRGKEPVPEAASPWAAEMVWLRGQLAERLLAAFRVEPADDVIRQIKEGEERHRTLLAHAPGQPVVPPSPEHLFRVTFEADEDRCPGLHGEVALRRIDAGAAPAPASVRVLVDGRVIEVLSLDRSTVPLPFEAAIAWPGRLRPRFSYEGVERDDRLRAAVGYALQVALLVVDGEARRLFGIGEGAAAPQARAASEEEQRRIRPVIRAALGALLSARGDPMLAEAAEALAPAELPGLHRAPAWPTSERRRFESLQALEAYAGTRKALCFAPPPAEGRAVDGRPVVAAGPNELAWIAAALPGCELVPYERALFAPEALRGRKEERRRALSQALAALTALPASAPTPAPRELPVLESARPYQHALATLSDAHVEVWHHALRPLEVAGAKPLYAPIAVVIDSDALMPDRAFRKAIAGRSPGVVWTLERELCEAVVAALEGDPAAAERLQWRPPGPGEPPSTRITAYLLRCAKALQQRTGYVSAPAAERELCARLRQVPLVTLLDAAGKPELCSLARLEEVHPLPGRIPVLDAAPEFETLDWRPAVARDGRERDALFAWAGGHAAPASEELPARRARAEEERVQRAFLAGPLHDAQALGDLADAPSPPNVEQPPRLVVSLLGPAPAAPAASAASAAPAASPAPPPTSPRLGFPVTAALPRAGLALELAWVDVLFCRRALCRRALPLPVPVVARVDVDDPSFVEGWRDLSAAGMAAVTRRVHEAAIALAFRILTEASLAKKHEVLFGDARALTLLARLLAPVPSPIPLDQGRAAPLAASLRDGALGWPTVQSGWEPLARLRAAGEELFFGARAHAPWREGQRRSDLDDPVLLLPEGGVGQAMRAILEAIGVKLRDVSAAVEVLQARRAASAGPGEAPRLPGAPAHPMLRRTLAQLKVTEADGEAEVIEGPASEVQMMGIDGELRPMPAEVVLPLRVIARVDDEEPSRELTERILRKLAKTMGKHLLAHPGELDAMPPFVRAHLRRALCRSLAEGKRIRPEANSAPLFQDTLGQWHSLGEIKGSGSEAVWACTHAPPPYPTRAYTPPILCLSVEERLMLQGALAIRDYTMIVAKDLEGERRAAAPPLPAVALDPTTRGRCFEVLPFTEPESGHAGHVSGEIGLLLPAHAELAGISVHVGRRPLCRIDAGDGWPIRAAVNDDALTPNRYFDALGAPRTADRLRERVGAVATRALRARFTPPPDALATRWVEQALPSVRVFVAGLLWLPAEWPVAPRVTLTVLAAGGSRSSPRALSMPLAARGVSGVIPVGGELLLWPDGALGEGAQIALRAAASMVAELAAARPANPHLAAYQWNLRLLGATEGGVPTAPVTAGGREDPSGAMVVGPSEVFAELSARGCVWVTRGEGSALGRFPQGAPGFVLRQGSPLEHVLRHRGQDLVRELGGLEEPEPEEPEVTAGEGAGEGEGAGGAGGAGTAMAPRIPAGAAPDRALVAPPVAAFAAGAPGVARAGVAAWVGQLWQSVRSVLTGDGTPVDTRGESELAAAVHEALAALRLAGDPVERVVEARAGRPVRYEERTRRVVLNPHHEALAWARSRSPRDPGLVAVLAAAAVGEINRALRSVTDAEERLALDELLRSMEGT